MLQRSGLSKTTTLVCGKILRNGLWKQRQWFAEASQWFSDTDAVWKQPTGATTVVEPITVVEATAMLMEEALEKAVRNLFFSDD